MYPSEGKKEEGTRSEVKVGTEENAYAGCQKLLSTAKDSLTFCGHSRCCKSIDSIQMKRGKYLFSVVPPK